VGRAESRPPPFYDGFRVFIFSFYRPALLVQWLTRLTGPSRRNVESSRYRDSLDL